MRAAPLTFTPKNSFIEFVIPLLGIFNSPILDVYYSKSVIFPPRDRKKARSLLPN